MSSNLNQLKKQKQLIEEHLRWLDQEIANASGQSVATLEENSAKPEEPTTAYPQPPLQDSGGLPVAAFEKADEPDDADILSEQLISQYAHASGRREMDPRLSLILFFGCILGFLALTVFLVYWFGYR